VLRRLSPLETSREHPPLGDMVRFGLKGLLGWVSPIEGLRVDQQIVGVGLSSTALGLYVVAQSLTNLPRFAAQSIGMVGYPTISGQASAHEAQRSMWQFFWISVALCGALTALLELASGPLIRFFYGDEFESAIALARILLVSALLLGVRRCLADGARGLGRPTIGTVAEASMWVVLAPLVPVLATGYGVNGVAVALAIASGVALLVLVLPLALGWPSPSTASRLRQTRRESAAPATAAGRSSPTSAS
jgi:Na+-driven multidrug efflux pump